MSPGESSRSSLILHFKERALMKIRWTLSPRDRCVAIVSDAPHRSMSPAIKTKEGNIVPHRENKEKGRAYKVRWFYGLASSDKRNAYTYNNNI